MKKLLFNCTYILALSSLSGCTLIEDGFKAGVIFTIIIIAIIGAIIWAVRFSANQISKKYKVQTIPVKNKQIIREV